MFILIIKMFYQLEKYKDESTKAPSAAIQKKPSLQTFLLPLKGGEVGMGGRRGMAERL